MIKRSEIRTASSRTEKRPAPASGKTNILLAALSSAPKQQTMKHAALTAAAATTVFSCTTPASRGDSRLQRAITLACNNDQLVEQTELRAALPAAPCAHDKRRLERGLQHGAKRSWARRMRG
jgi:hypothetical protein